MMFIHEQDHLQQSTELHALKETLWYQRDYISYASYFIESKNVLLVSTIDFVKVWKINSATGTMHCLSSWEKSLSSYINAFTSLANGWLVTARLDNTMACWKLNDDASQADCLATWQQSSDSTNVLTTLSNNTVVSGNGDGSLIIWKIDPITGGGMPLATYKQHTENIRTLLFLPNSRLLLSASVDNSIKCWSVNKNAQALTYLSTWEGHHDSVNTLSVLSNDWIVSGSDDKTMRCWHIDQSTGDAICLAVWKGHIGRINSLATLPNGWLVSAGDRIAYWAVKKDGSAKCLTSFGKSYQSARTLTVLPSGFFISLHTDHLYSSVEIVGWRGISLCERSFIAAQKSWQAENISALIALSNTAVISGDLNGNIAYWKINENTGTAVCLSVTKAHNDGINSVVLLDNGWLLSSGNDKVIKCWQIDKKAGTIAHLATWTGHTDAITALIVLSDNRIISASKGIDGSIKCWEIDKTTGMGRCIATWCDGYGDIRSLALLSDGKVISAHAYPDRTGNRSALFCWQVNTQTGHARKIASEIVYDQLFTTMIVIENGYIVTNSSLGYCKSGEIICWKFNKASGKRFGFIAQWDTSVSYAMTALTDGRIMTHHDNFIRCWDVNKNTGNARCLTSWDELDKLNKQHRNRSYYIANAMTALPNGWLISAGENRKVNCWQYNANLSD